MRWPRVGTAAAAAFGIGVTLAAASGCGRGDDNAATPAPDPTSRETASALKGEEAVSKRRCASCHGADMSGGASALPGQVDARVELYPPNLTPDLETGLGDPTNGDPAKRGYTDDLLARAIRNGLDRDDLELCPQMKHFAEMTDFEVFSIVKYLRALPPVKKKILRSVCPPLKSKAEQAAAQ